MADSVGDYIRAQISSSTDNTRAALEYWLSVYKNRSVTTMEKKLVPFLRFLIDHDMNLAIMNPDEVHEAFLTLPYGSDPSKTYALSSVRAKLSSYVNQTVKNIVKDDTKRADYLDQYKALIGAMQLRLTLINQTTPIPELDKINDALDKVIADKDVPDMAVLVLEVGTRAAIRGGDAALIHLKKPHTLADSFYSNGVVRFKPQMKNTVEQSTRAKAQTYILSERSRNHAELRLRQGEPYLVSDIPLDKKQIQMTRDGLAANFYVNYGRYAKKYLEQHVDFGDIEKKSITPAVVRKAKVNDAVQEAVSSLDSEKERTDATVATLEKNNHTGQVFANNYLVTAPVQKKTPTPEPIQAQSTAGPSSSVRRGNQKDTADIAEIRRMEEIIVVLHSVGASTVEMQRELTQLKSDLVKRLSKEFQSLKRKALS